MKKLFILSLLVLSGCYLHDDSDKAVIHDLKVNDNVVFKYDLAGTVDTRIKAITADHRYILTDRSTFWLDTSDMYQLSIVKP